MQENSDFDSKVEKIRIRYIKVSESATKSKSRSKSKGKGQGKGWCRTTGERPTANHPACDRGGQLARPRKSNELVAH